MSQFQKIRIDKWLWAARFFKTRALASKAVDGGKVHVNGQRVKSSRPVQIGDQLEITISQTEFVVDIRDLSDKRGPAKIAQTLYAETPDSIEKRQKFSEQRKILHAAMQRSQGKPDKHQRKQIRKISGKL
jgi:ribosome-associated heat shock protein Hsp15